MYGIAAAGHVNHLNYSIHSDSSGNMSNIDLEDANPSIRNCYSFCAAYNVVDQHSTVCMRVFAGLCGPGHCLKTSVQICLVCQCVSCICMRVANKLHILIICKGLQLWGNPQNCSTVMNVIRDNINQHLSLYPAVCQVQRCYTRPLGRTIYHSIQLVKDRLRYTA